MIYVGVVAKLLSLDMKEVETAIRRQFSTKVKAADLNWNAAKASFDYAETTLTKEDPFRIERMNKTEGQIIIDGNAAAALGAMFAGVSVVTWYPITPSSSLVENLIEYMKEHRIGPDGKATFAIVQAEDELAAIGMVLGGGWMGARSMTATAGPGISLMAEFTGLGYYVEIPAVVWDVQRVGPSTGLPTRTSQGDIMKVANLSHGDARHPMLFPSTVAECFEMAGTAFDLAETLQTPVFVMSDLDLGMNNWMSEPFKYPEKPLQRGKVLSAAQLTRLGSYGRYKDVDGDGIPYRTTPGTRHPQAAWFARGSGHNEKAQYTERPDDYVNNMDRLARKFSTARKLVPGADIVQDGGKVGLIAYGTSHHAIVETLSQLLKEYGVGVDYMRLRGFPFGEEVHDFIARHDRVYVVDQNRDGQMFDLLKLDIKAEHVTKLRSVRHYNGLPLDARTVTEAVLAQEEVK
jgi:2-oxoglutarate ferredoxin oxidoreductase subunit alpha